MNRRMARWAFLAVILVIAATLHAQVTGATLSGTVTSLSGAAVPNAKVSVKNTATGQSVETQTDAGGVYKVPDLAPGRYELSVSAEAFNGKVAEVDVVSEANQTMNMALTPTLSLQGLGFPSSQTQGNALEQARLDKRTRMLRTHQRLGLITTAPLLATVIAGSYAGGKSTSSGARDFHAALGSVTAGMYVATAYYAIRAPKIPGTKTEGPIRLHKALAWIHGPGMVLTPILGAIAFSQKSNGQKVHGIASAHGPVAYVTAGAYGLAILSVSLKKF